MNDKYVKLADVKRKLRYIFKAYGVGGFVREKVERALNNLPYSVKGDLETTLETADVQPVMRGKWGTKDVVKILASGKTLDGFCQCENCGSVYPLHYAEYSYCPNCGAKMDGGADGENN